MLARIRARLTYANVGVTVALVLGTTGFAVAASSSSSSSTITACVARRGGHVRIVSSTANCGRRERKVSWNKRGPRGFAGARGSRGAQGARGSRGSTGARGATGAQGPAGPLLDQLPTGRTLRGAYEVSGMEVNGAIQNIQGSGVSFQFPLAAAPSPHFVPAGTGPSPSCPGSAAAPAAAAGQLCVYEGGNLSRGPVTFQDPTVQTGSGTTRWGFVLAIEPINTTSSYSFRSYGTWAVTAP